MVRVGIGRRVGLLALVAAVAAGVNACGSAAPSATPLASPASTAPSGPPATRRPNDILQPPGAAVSLKGVGATLPAPLYQVWFDRFSATYANVSIAYAPQGSVAGIEAAISRAASFGATDVAMTDAEIAASPSKLLHIPMALGAVAVIVNLPDVAAVQLDGPTIAAIYLGRITRWSDQQIAALNPGLVLPDLPIALVHRSDPSGTTNGFAAYLDASSPDWHAEIGAGRTVAWPTGDGVVGDDGVATAVRATPGAIGYAASTFAAATGLRTAGLRNSAGNFVRATTLAIAAAGETSVAGLPSDFRQKPVVDCPRRQRLSDRGLRLPARADGADRPPGGRSRRCVAWLVPHNGPGGRRTAGLRRLAGRCPGESPCRAPRHHHRWLGHLALTTRGLTPCGCPGAC